MSGRTVLPQHDALSWLTRSIEVVCIVVAVTLPVVPRMHAGG
ncbi:MAG: hypothetical protein Q7T30_03750 [Planctomycetota bacterium]|nr:hypothetical protein [Planctomycetota bacterium]